MRLPRRSTAVSILYLCAHGIDKPQTGSQAQESHLIYSLSVILITVIKVNMTDERAMDDVRLNAATHVPHMNTAIQ